jgi:alpha-L-fucosidase
LLNVGPTADGTLTAIETEILKYIGFWIKNNEEFIYEAVPSEIEADNADIFVKGEYYYAAIRKVPMSANVNVTRLEDNKVVKLHTDKTIKEAVWLDNGSEVELTDGQTFKAQAFLYGTSGSVRIARFKLQ